MIEEHTPGRVSMEGRSFYANTSSQSTGKCLQTNLIIRERNQIFLRPLETQSDQTKIIRVLLLILERCECMLVLKRGKIPISRIHLGAADKMLKCHSSPSSNGITSLIPNSVQSPVLRLWPSASQLSITFAKVWDKQCPGLTHILLLLVVKSGKYCDTHSPFSFSFVEFFIRIDLGISNFLHHSTESNLKG